MAYGYGITGSVEATRLVMSDPSKNELPSADARWG